MTKGVSKSLTRSGIFRFDEVEVAFGLGFAEIRNDTPVYAVRIDDDSAFGGTLEHAQSMAAHESPRTTKLYDRTKERLTQDEVERIML
jgi:hypothetical protein